MYIREAQVGYMFAYLEEAIDSGLIRLFLQHHSWWPSIGSKKSEFNINETEEHMMEVNTKVSKLQNLLRAYHLTWIKFL